MSSRVGLRRLACAVALAPLAAAAIDLAACGNSPTIADGGDAGDAAAEADVTSGCNASDASEPDALVLSFDGGIDLFRLRLAMSIARCNYFARCTPLAGYVIDNCEGSFANFGAWSPSTCWMGNCGGPTFATWPSSAVVQEVKDGSVDYDASAAYACLQALQAEPCTAADFLTGIPACVGVFSCPDGGAPDSGCAAQFGSGSVTTACTTPADCVDAAAGPYCSGGYCSTTVCDLSTCTFVSKGQPCDSELLFNDVALPLGTMAKTCAPGLTCRGLAVDGGLGTCDDARDIGGACIAGATYSGCALGLGCPCGTCALPPTQGPCVGGVCQMSVSYCAADGTCQPLGGLGASCSFKRCETDLICDPNTNECTLPH